MARIRNRAMSIRIIRIYLNGIVSIQERNEYTGMTQNVSILEVEIKNRYYSQPIRNHYEKHDVSEVFYSSDLSCSFISSTRIGSPFNARSISSELFTPCLCPVSR